MTSTRLSNMSDITFTSDTLVIYKWAISSCHSKPGFRTKSAFQDLVGMMSLRGLFPITLYSVIINQQIHSRPIVSQDELCSRDRSFHRILAMADSCPFITVIRDIIRLLRRNTKGGLYCIKGERDVWREFALSSEFRHRQRAYKGSPLRRKKFESPGVGMRFPHVKHHYRTLLYAPYINAPGVSFGGTRNNNNKEEEEENSSSSVIYTRREREIER